MTLAECWASLFGRKTPDVVNSLPTLDPKRRIAVGDIVVTFFNQNDDHIFEFIGQVTRFELQVAHESAMELARIVVVKFGNKDYRDGRLGVVQIPIKDSRLLYLATGLWSYVK